MVSVVLGLAIVSQGTGLVIPDKSNSASEEDEIIYVSLTYLIEDHSWRNYWGKSKAKLFLKVNGQNPSPSLYKRISTLKPPIYGSSFCDDTSKGVFDKKTGSPSHLYDLKSIAKSDNDKPQVHFCLRSIGWGGTMATLTLSKIKGHWQVIHISPIIKA